MRAGVPASLELPQWLNKNAGELFVAEVGVAAELDEFGSREIGFWVSVCLISRATILWEESIYTVFVGYQCYQTKHHDSILTRHRFTCVARVWFARMGALCFALAAGLLVGVGNLGFGLVYQRKFTSRR